MRNIFFQSPERGMALLFLSPGVAQMEIAYAGLKVLCRSRGRGRGSGNGPVQRVP